MTVTDCWEVYTTSSFNVIIVLNTAPFFNPVLSAITVCAGQSFYKTYVISDNEDNSNTIISSTSFVPAFIAYDAESMVIIILPASGDVGSYPITFTLMDILM